MSKVNAISVSRPDQASLELINEVQQFLYREARINDAEQFRDWLDMFTEDIHYWIPYCYQRYRKDVKEPTIYDMAYFNDTLADLNARVKRTEGTTCWSEDPAIRVAHVVTI